MNLLLEYKNTVMYEMIQKDSSVTLGQYWKELYDEQWCPAVKVIASNRRFSRARREPVKDPSPCLRPPAIYSNRSHTTIINELG